MNESKPDDITHKLLHEIFSYSNETTEFTLDKENEEIPLNIAGYYSKELKKCSECDLCKTMLTSDLDIVNTHYLNLLSRGCLTVPPPSLVDFICSSFVVILYFVDKFVKYFFLINVIEALQWVLNKYLPNFVFSCPQHIDWGCNFDQR